VIERRNAGIPFRIHDNELGVLQPDSAVPEAVGLLDPVRRDIRNIN
jgi:hypothetical protein